MIGTRHETISRIIGGLKPTEWPIFPAVRSQSPAWKRSPPKSIA